MKKVLLLGASGSIGNSALSILRNHTDIFKLVGASCHSNDKFLFKIASEFNLTEIALSSTKEINQTPSNINLYLGEMGLKELIYNSSADIVINGIAGSAGLYPSVWTLENGKDLALANKETIVMAGDLVKQLAKKNNCKILPVDSEHAAIFELIDGKNINEIKAIWLTASGGAFRERDLDSFHDITVEEALNHPTWKMGTKITIDSATMANKGLEFIEAVRLFNFDPDKIHVVIQPTSQVHSLIQTIDGNFYAQLSNPDMALPILNAISYPIKISSNLGNLDLYNLNLQFSKPEKARYPMLALAYQAAKIGGDATIIFNSANEAAVENFIQGKISYLEISKTVEKALQKATGEVFTSIKLIVKLHKETYQSILL